MYINRTKRSENRQKLTSCTACDFSERLAHENLLIEMDSFVHNVSADGHERNHAHYDRNSVVVLV